ncbi:MAG TPA: hypothetical protein VJT49_16855 [Amycolatopsis sp.]|uniref:hypothetical protein n=1 Tax=Amycolatopsis sp. TaxID=37632 RepID=UPI002B469793|nr:hypothetical protein [Amycolatopsis sp.]HKS46744.1 hypothetical protein [Amycolatopsis sp.]
MSHLDRTGELLDPDTAGHRPGIDCLPGGWMLGHGPDDDTMRGCPVCRPKLTDEARRARLWGTNPDARPRTPETT